MQWAFAIIVLGSALVAVVYGLVRGAAFAYFRTKYEFLRRKQKLMQGD
jgi:hypothetical protein